MLIFEIVIPFSLEKIKYKAEKVMCMENSIPILIMNLITITIHVNT